MPHCLMDDVVSTLLCHAYHDSAKSGSARVQMVVGVSATCGRPFELEGEAEERAANCPTKRRTRKRRAASGLLACGSDHQVSPMPARPGDQDHTHEDVEDRTPVEETVRSSTRRMWDILADGDALQERAGAQSNWGQIRDGYLSLQ